MNKRKNRLIGYEVENVGKIKVMKINLDNRPITVIAGKNDQGKTTAIDAIGMLLNVKFIPDDPVRHGQNKAIIKGYLDTEKFGRLTAIRKINKKEDGSFTQKLEIFTDAGDLKKNPPPKALLEELFGERSYDPLDFMMRDKKPQEKRKAQTEFLIELLGIKEDLDRVREQRARIFEERTKANHKVEELENQLKKYTGLKEVKEVNVQDILVSLSKAEQANKYNESIREQLKNDETAIFAERKMVDQEKVRMAEIQKEIERLKIEFNKLQEDVEKRTKDGLLLKERILQNKELVKTLKDINTSVYHEQLSLVGETNKQAELWKQRIEIEAEYKVAKDNQTDKNLKLQELDNTEKLLLKDADFPIEGLAFTEAGVTYQGVLLDQLGDSQQFKVCLSIMSKVNPNMPVVRIDRWESFDSDFKKMIEQELISHDLLAIVSMVSAGGVGIILKETGDGSEVVFDEYGDNK